METYKNSYNKNENMMLWELHEIRHELHKEFSRKTVYEINRDARRKFREWCALYSANHEQTGAQPANQPDS